jgi:hypothetical protein
MARCPVCRVSEARIEEKSDVLHVACTRCGVFGINETALHNLEEVFSTDKYAPNKLSYALRTRSNRNPGFLVDTANLQTMVLQTNLPTAPQQLDNLIYLLGESLPDPAHRIIVGNEHAALIGARSAENLAYVVESAKALGFIEGQLNIRLTISGWTLYSKLKKGQAAGKQAFMAMKFCDSLMDSIYHTYFKPAVSDTGFELKRLDEGQPAGLIDDYLRVQIRNSRFLIADLTHHNNGAYWEAGYAEGLGKSVIYTCEKSVFDDKENTTHFDTNHHLTVVWESDKLEDAVRRLKATIRATFPEDATMEDSLPS